MNKIPFNDIKRQYTEHKSDIDAAVMKVLDSGQYIMGAQVEELEQRLAMHLGVDHAIAVSSGTDALVMMLMAMGLKENDAVFTSPFTFFASAEAISLAGATPVFVDIDPRTYNMSATELERAIKYTIENTNLTPKVVLPVDLFGQKADYQEINKVAQKYNLTVFEDAAQSYSAAIDGARTGNFGRAAATSFYPAKPLGCYGDGGAIFTNDEDLKDELLSIRVHGQSLSHGKYDNVRIGLNARMDTIQAAILLEKLKFYDEDIAARNLIAEKYNTRLEGLVDIPYVPASFACIWAQYSVQSEKRTQIIEALNAAGIPTAIFYPIPIHLSAAYKHLGHVKGDFPNTEATSTTIFSLPMHAYIDDELVDNIGNIIEASL